MKQKITAIAQEDPKLTFVSSTGKPITVKGNKKCMLIIDLKTKTFKVESLWWFRFKKKLGI